MRRHLRSLSLVVPPLFIALAAAPSLAQWQVDGVPLCTAALDQLFPAVVGDGAGAAIVTWQDYRGGPGHIYAQHVLASGAPDAGWPPDGLALSTASGDQSGPQLVRDGSGGAIVAWSDLSSGTSDIYAQHVLASGALDPTWPVAGVPLCAAARNQENVGIIADGAGGAIVTWYDERDSTDDEIYAQHVLHSGTVDPVWPVDGRALGPAADETIVVPTIVGDGAGGAIVTWYDDRSGLQSYDIFAQHIVASGKVDPTWPPGGRTLCTAPGWQIHPQIAGDGAAGAIVAWQDARNGYYDIYAEHVLASGAVDPAWPADGRALCTAANHQDTPQIVADGTGGAIVTWQDYRGGSTYNIYAQRVLPSGTVDPAWPADGRALCTAPTGQILPRIVADGAGGAIVTWQYMRNTSFDSDIFAQHVLASGAVDAAWPVDGRALCKAANNQRSPAIAEDGAGGAIVAWQDHRNGDYDIYAQRVYASGAVGAVPPATVPARIALLPPYPNPWAAGVIGIPFELSASGRVSAQVFDLAGHRVRTLAIEREFPTGRQALEWDGRDDARSRVPSGIYFVRVRVGEHSDARRIVRLD